MFNKNDVLFQTVKGDTANQENNVALIVKVRDDGKILHFHPTKPSAGRKWAPASWFITVIDRDTLIELAESNEDAD